MAIAVFQSLRNLKVRYKVSLIFIVMFFLMLDLAALNITSVTDIRDDTQRISDQLIPRLVQTSRIKDRLNESILAAYDYVQTGDTDSKDQYRAALSEALVAQIDLFYLSTSEADFEFTTSFQTHINQLNDDLESLIFTYETGGSQAEIQEQLAAVSASRDLFAFFLREEIEVKIQAESQAEREATAAQVQQTIINVAVVGVIAFIALVLLFSFVRRSITEPLRRLTVVAEDIGKGNFRAVEVTSRDELGLFAETFNTMTARIQATQEALVVELEKTKKLDRQKSEFLAIAAHQLRTPMAGIKWVVSMATEGDLGKLPDEASEQLGKSLENIDRMISLINSLLDVTQIETKGLELEPRGADPVEVLSGVVSNVEHAAEAAQVKVSVAKPSQALPSIRVDVDKIGMVFRNLLDNAIKYTPKGGSVTVGFQPHDDAVDITIADTGYGIPKAEQDRIFTKFYRGSNIQTIVADGSGLGLFIVNEIVKMHDGTVQFESEEGKGTTFTITLPVYHEPAAAPVAVAAPAPTPAPVPEPKKKRKK